MISTVYRKELLDIVRDRRTLIAMVVLPVVLYPVLVIGMAQLAELQEQRQAAEPVQVGVPDARTEQWLNHVIETVNAARAEQKQRLETAQPDPAAEEPEEGPIAPQIVRDPRQAVEDERIAVAVRQSITQSPTGRPRPAPIIQIIVNNASDRSRNASGRVRRLLVEYRGIIIKKALAATELEAALSFEIALDNRADRDGELRWVLAKITPLILILMTITSAIYPAIDLTAGERERGTLETLMVCPVPTASLIIGKFFVVLTVAMAAATLNLASIGATIHFIGVDALLRPPEAIDPLASTPADSPPEEPDAPTERAEPAGSGLVWVFGMILVTMVPFAVLASAVLIAVCSFARTFKECQNYVTPVILACLLPCFAAVLPGTQLAGPMLVVPVGNMALLTRELLLGHFDAMAFATVLLSTSLYAVAAVALATQLFGQEAVVFSDSASWRSVFDRRLMRPRRLPTATQALVITALLFPANFYIQGSLRHVGTEDPVRQLILIGLTIWLLMGLLPLLTAMYLKLDVASTFRLRVPPARFWLAGVLVGASTWVVAHELFVIQSQFLELPPTLIKQAEQLERTFARMRPEVILFILAVIPGVCEELFFRGFLLSTVSAGGRRWPTILLTAAVFAFFHVSLWRIGVTFTLGVFLGLLCWQSGSVLPGLLAHMMHNGLAVSMQLFPQVKTTLGLDGYKDEAHLPLHYLAGAAILLTAALLLLRRGPQPPLPTAEGPVLDASEPVAAPGQVAPGDDLDSTP